MLVISEISDAISESDQLLIMLSEELLERKSHGFTVFNRRNFLLFTVLSYLRKFGVLFIRNLLSSTE